MKNISRTTLRELKKRYLNILKKCFLVNLGIILLSTPSMAEEIVFDEVYDSIIKESTTGGYQGAFFRNKAEFGSVKFTNNTISTTHNLQGGFGVVWSGSSTTFKGHVLVENNTFGSGTYGYGGFINVGLKSTVTFETAEFLNNTFTFNPQSGSQIVSGGGTILSNEMGFIHLKGETLFQGNFANKGYGGAIYNQGSGTKNTETNQIEKYGITFDQKATFIGNEATKSGGAIQNGGYHNYSGSILFKDNAYFGVKYNNDGTKTILGNKAASGGAIYNYKAESTITFNSKAEFVNNESQNGSGGAIYNLGGSVVFEDTDGNPETPTVANITYGITFNGDTLFTGNKAESESGTARGGAIYNSGYMLLAGENTFDSNQAKQGGVIYNTGGKKNNDTIAYGMTLGKSTFMNNTGGSIFNTGYIDFTDDVDFIKGGGGVIYNTQVMDFSSKIGIVSFVENKSYNQGGLYNNAGVINFEGGVVFRGNEALSTTTGATGGVVYNRGDINFNSCYENIIFDKNISNGGAGAIDNIGLLKFNGITVFSENKAISGGALISAGKTSKVTFNNQVEFKNNTASAGSGGAIYNKEFSEIDFNGKSVFSQNISKNGGAIYNEGRITFNQDFEFKNNMANIPNDISNAKTGTINFDHGLDKNGVALVGSLDGGIANGGIINKTGTGTLILGDGMKNSGGGTFTQSAGLTIAHTEHFLTGTNTITGGELRVHGDSLANLKASVSNGAMLTYLTTRTERQNVALGTNVSVIGANVTFGAYEGVEQAQYTLGSDIANDARALKVIIQDSNIKMTGDTYAGSYEIGSSNVIEMRDESIGEQSVTFADLDGSGATLSIDIALLKDSEGKTQLTADRLNLTSDGEGYKFAGVSFNTPMDGQALLDEILSGLTVGQDGTITPSIKHTVQVLGGNASFMGRKEATLSTASPYVYEVLTAGQNLTVSADVLKGSALEYLNDTDTDVTLQIAEKGTTDYTVTEDLGTMGCGKKQILGSTSDATESVIDASGKNLFTLDKADTELGIKNLTITGAGTAIDNQAGKAHLENVVIKDTVGDTALKNGAILTLKDVSVDKGVVNSSKLTMSGNNALTTLTNSGETMVEGGKLSVTTLGGAGTLTMNGAELDATTISTDNKIVSNGMSLSNGLTTFEVKSLEVKDGTTLDLNLAMTTADKIKNEGDMIANKDLSVGALEGTGTLTMNNATLDVADKFATSNKVVSNNMKIGDNVTSEIHFADLEIKDNTTLDIKTLQATANTVTVGENATLGITLKNLDEYGTMKADEIIAKEDSKVHLTLGDNFAGGVFDVFKGTKGSGDLELVHNNVYNVVEVSEGKYSFMAKDTEALQESLGTTDNETVIANALTQGTTGHAVFSRMQSEMLVALQSQNKETVAKAKKALNAVGSTDQSAVQSVTTEHIGAIFNVVKSEMPSAIGGTGRSGGEEETRAKVYIKGLYDQTKSTMGEGFKARSKGAVLGVQSQISEDLTVGVGYAFSNTIAKEDLRRTEADTNTAFASVHYQPNAWWMSGLATYSRANYDEKKEILSTTGTANYNLDSWGVQVMTGYDVKLDRSVITPEVGIRYLSLKQEGYTDTLGTTVEGTKADYVTAMIGVRGMLNLGAIRPTAGFSIGYDVVTDDISAVNTLANGATYTVNSEKLDKLSTIVTLGFKADISKNTSFSLEYSGTFRKEYQDHSGMLRFNYSF